MAKYLVTEDELLSANVTETGELEFTRDNGEKIVAGNVKGEPGATGPAGPNTVPTYDAINQALTEDGPVKDQLSATIAEEAGHKTVLVDARDFGAKFDGLTNDTDAIQAALDASSSLTIGGKAIAGMVPLVGPARVGTLYLRSRSFINGAFQDQSHNSGSAQLIPDGIEDDHYMFEAESTITHAGIIGLTADGGGASKGFGFARFDTGNNLVFRGLRVTNWGLEGLRLAGGNHRIRNSLIQGMLNADAATERRGALTLGGGDHQVTFCEITGRSGGSISSVNLNTVAGLITCSSSAFVGTVFQTGDVGMATASGANLNRFVACRFDYNAAHGALLSGGYLNTFSACHFNRNSQASPGTYNHMEVPSNGMYQTNFIGTVYSGSSVNVNYAINDARTGAGQANTHAFPVFDASVVSGTHAMAASRLVTRNTGLTLGATEISAPDTTLSRTDANVLSMGSGDSFALDGTWNGGHLRMGDHRLWVDGSGNLRIKNGAPSSSTDGAIVGTQA